MESLFSVTTHNWNWVWAVRHLKTKMWGASWTQCLWLKHASHNHQRCLLLSTQPQANFIGSDGYSAYLPSDPVKSRFLTNIPKICFVTFMGNVSNRVSMCQVMCLEPSMTMGSGEAASSQHPKGPPLFIGPLQRCGCKWQELCAVFVTPACWWDTHRDAKPCTSETSPRARDTAPWPTGMKSTVKAVLTDPSPRGHV